MSFGQMGLGKFQGDERRVGNEVTSNGKKKKTIKR